MGLWSSLKAKERREQDGNNGQQQPRLGQEDRWSRRKPWSKVRRDRERSMMREEKFAAQRRERLALFGYVKTKNGVTYSITEASALLVKGELRAEDVDVWSQPESFRDVLASLGEVDAMEEYPALGITKGTVLFDPKIRVPGGYRDAALRHSK